MVHGYAVQVKNNTATSQPRMLDTKVIDKESATDPAIKELNQLMEGGTSEDSGTGRGG